MHKHLSDKQGTTLLELIVAMGISSIIVLIVMGETIRMLKFDKLMEVYTDRLEIIYSFGKWVDCQQSLRQCKDSADNGADVTVYQKWGSLGKVLVKSPDYPWGTWRVSAKCDFQGSGFRQIIVSGKPRVDLGALTANLVLARDIQGYSYPICGDGPGPEDPNDPYTISVAVPFNIPGADMSAAPIVGFNDHNCEQMGLPNYPASGAQKGVAHRVGVATAACPDNSLLIGGSGFFSFANLSLKEKAGIASGFFPMRNSSDNNILWRVMTCGKVTRDYTEDLTQSGGTAICNPRTLGGRFR